VVHFFLKKVDHLFTVALETQAANATDCFTVKIKQIKRSDMVRFFKFSIHTITEAKHRQGGARAVDLPARLTWRALV